MLENVPDWLEAVALIVTAFGVFLSGRATSKREKANQLIDLNKIAESKIKLALEVQQEQIVKLETDLKLAYTERLEIKRERRLLYILMQKFQRFAGRLVLEVRKYDIVAADTFEKELYTLGEDIYINGS